MPYILCGGHTITTLRRTYAPNNNALHDSATGLAAGDSTGTRETTAPCPSNRSGFGWQLERLSLTQTEVLTLINSTYGTVKGYRRGSLVTLRIDWKSSASGSWNTGNFGTLPESWRPPMDLNFSYGGRDGANQKIINVNANGTMTYANQGGTQGTTAFGMTVSYAL